MQPIYINIATSILIIIVAFVAGLKLYKKKDKVAKVLGLIWILAGISILTNILLDIFYYLDMLDRFNALLILFTALFAVMLVGCAAYVFIFIILVNKRKKWFPLLIIPFAVYALYFYSTYIGDWEELKYSSWGVETTLPYLTTVLFLIATLPGLLIIIYIVLRETYYKFKDKPYDINWLLGGLSILVLAIFGSLDVVGLFSDWALVLNRMMLLVSAIIAYFCYHGKKH